ncbi:MAG: TetR/AcrR family transcriptional regulator [Candidatus Hydrogenedentes bacterium]|nr:TetR/AcrR family transcriptional regulator [Candidatus Hydrogenedentota bacterium]
MPVRSPEMRARLAESAFDLFADQGFDGVNLEAIAAHAGVTKGSLYHHYNSKKEVVLASCRFYYRSWHRMIQERIAPVRDPLERLTAVLRLSVKTCLFDGRNRLFTASILALSLMDEDVQAGWAQFYDSVRETYVGLVEAALAAGQLEVAEPRRAADLMLAAMEGIKQRASFEPEIASEEEQQRILEDLLGILGAGQPPAQRGAA